MQNTETSPPTLDEQNSLGEIRINHSVIASIVRLAALEVPGVVAVGGSFVDGIAEFFSKKESDRGVKIDEDDTGNYAIEIRIVVRFGSDIARTAYQVQMAVRRQVVNMTGKNVTRIDVVVEGVKMEVPPKTEDPSDDPWPHAPATD